MGAFPFRYGAFKDPGYQKQEKETTVRPFHFLQWELPISYKEVTLRSKEDIVRELYGERSGEGRQENGKKRN